MKLLSFHSEIIRDIKGSYNRYKNQFQSLKKEFLYELGNKVPCACFFYFLSYSPYY